MRSISIRDAVEADAEQLSLFYAAIHNLHATADPRTFKPVGSDTFPASDWTQILRSADNLVSIAAVDGVPAGYTYAGVRRINDNWGMYPVTYIYINQVGVSSEFEGLGVGQALMAHVRKLAIDRRIQDLSLDVWGFNTRARAFFVKQGFFLEREQLRLSLLTV